MRFNLDKIVKNLQSRAPSMYLGTVTEVSSGARCSVLIDGTDYPITGIRTLAHVAVDDRVQLVHDKRRIVILGAIQRTDKLVADNAIAFGGQPSWHFMRYLPGNHPGVPINGFDANTVDRAKPSMIPMYNGVNTPSKNAAVLETIPYSADWVAQYFHEMHADGGGLFRRTFHSGTTWSAWTQL